MTERFVKDQSHVVLANSVLAGEQEIARLTRENAKLIADYDLRTDQLNAEVKWREQLEAKLAVAMQENAELREMFSGTTDGLASYAFREYGHDAKLYNGIADLQARLAASEQNAAYWACKATEEAEQSKPLRDKLAAAEADTKRLDWLESRKYACFGLNCHDDKWVYQIETGGYAARGATLRAAIDDANPPERAE